MLIKAADDRSQEVTELETRLATSPPQQRAVLERDLRALRAGIKGERDAAYLIDFDLATARYVAVIHDLRLEVNGRVAQIDHLLIHRTLNVFVLETKHFHAGLKITEEGEFLRWNDFRKTYEGMPSPFAQNERHIAVLRDAFRQIDMPKRLGIRLSPTFVSFVVVSPNSRIDRPKGFDTTRVIKADMILRSLIKKLDDESIIETLATAGKFVSSDTVMDIARKLIALHVPAHRPSSPQAGSTRIEQVEPQHVRVATREPALADHAWGKTNTHSCRACGSRDLAIVHGRYGYYFKCRPCSANTPIKLGCGKAGHNERLRKQANQFFRECGECQSSELFHSNPN